MYLFSTGVDQGYLIGKVLSCPSGDLLCYQDLLHGLGYVIPLMGFVAPGSAHTGPSAQAPIAVRNAMLNADDRVILLFLYFVVFVKGG